MMTTIPKKIIIFILAIIAVATAFLISTIILILLVAIYYPGPPILFGIISSSIVYYLFLGWPFLLIYRFRNTEYIYLLYYLFIASYIIFFAYIIASKDSRSPTGWFLSDFFYKTYFSSSMGVGEIIFTFVVLSLLTLAILMQKFQTKRVKKELEKIN